MEVSSATTTGTSGNVTVTGTSAGDVTLTDTASSGNVEVTIHEEEHSDTTIEVEKPKGNGRAIRDGLIRARPGVEMRYAGDGKQPTLHGHFARFNEWTEINSLFEGRFMERMAPGSFKKTFREKRDEIKVLFQHGRDTQIGDKPLGPIETLKEDREGAYYEVPLLDTQYNRELLPGLEAGLYGASFRFRVMREDIVNEPEPSEHNPEGIPERTVREAQVYEFGPVTFPAYANASAGVRAFNRETDRHFLETLVAEEPTSEMRSELDKRVLQRLIAQPDRLRELLLEFVSDNGERAEETHEDVETRDEEHDEEPERQEPESDESERADDVEPDNVEKDAPPTDAGASTPPPSGTPRTERVPLGTEARRRDWRLGGNRQEPFWRLSGRK